MPEKGKFFIAQRGDLDQLLALLAKQGFEIYGPTVKDAAIVYDAIASTADLPVGWTDHQEPGVYRLKKRDDQALFGYVVGPHSWKKFLQPAQQRLWQVEKKNGAVSFQEEKVKPRKLAFLGVRACEIKAIAIQDKVFLNDKFTDPHYQNNRKNNFIIAAQCTQSASTCFCVSMKTGPRSTELFDLALTEILEPGKHHFVIEVGSETGAKIIDELKLKPAKKESVQTAEKKVAETAANMSRKMNTDGIKELLYNNLDHPRWEEVAKRCLSCANCTMACPTCFCTTVEDVTDLTGEHAERWRKWDSCFTLDFSSIHGGSVRGSTHSRYRQWMTHKLATWWDQFNSSGCVGCGRCLTWCPVGIDITEEAAAIRATAKKETRNGNA